MGFSKLNGIVQHLTVGAVQVVQIVDTMLAFRPEELFPTAPDHAQLAPNRAGIVHLPVLVYAVTVDGSTTIVDTGVGAEQPEAGEGPGQLVTGLLSAGVEPAEVKRVLYTHLHPDHIGGGVNLRGRAVFRNAEYVVAAEEWSFWTLDIWRSPPWSWLGKAFERRLDPLAESGQLRLVTPNEELSPRLQLKALPGHTPGQVGLHIDTGAQPLLFIGDALHHPAQWRHPQWRYRDDADADMAIHCRWTLLDEIANTDTIIVSAHFPLPGIGHVRSQPDGALWQPLEI